MRRMHKKMLRAQVCKSTLTSGGLSLALNQEELMEAHDDSDLGPSLDRHSLESTKTIGNVLKFQVLAGADIPIEAHSLLDELTETGDHGRAAVLDLNSTVVLEVVLRATIRAILDQTKGTATNGRENRERC